MKNQIAMNQHNGESEVAQLCPTLCDPMDCNLPASSLWGFPGKSTRVSCHFLLQGIFPAQGSNLSLPHCRQTLYRLSHQGSPNIMVLVLNRKVTCNVQSSPPLSGQSLFISHLLTSLPQFLLSSLHIDSNEFFVCSCLLYLCLYVSWRQDARHFHVYAL